MTDITSSPVVRRHPENPILSAGDVPYPATLVFNAGFAKFQGRYVCVFRNDVCPPEDPTNPHETNPLLLQTLASQGMGVVTISEVPRSLEDVYLRVVREE